jgi:hypothetical protein
MRRPDPECIICGRKCSQKSSGRRRRYCSRACQQVAYRMRLRAGVRRPAPDLNALLEQVMKSD